jgi:hypothetical protein
MPGGIPPALREKNFPAGSTATSFAFTGQISEGSDRRIKRLLWKVAPLAELQRGGNPIAHKRKSAKQTPPWVSSPLMRPVLNGRHPKTASDIPP